MTRIAWDATGEKVYESGVDQAVLYIPTNGLYVNGYGWNGITAVTESPSGAEATPQYADNIKYLNLVSNEDFGATIEAFTYPEQFAQCDGSATPQPGVYVAQQGRKVFGLCYRTKVGDDVNGQDSGYKLHLVYGCLAAPSEKAYSTVNDSPEATPFSWDVTTSPVAVTGLKPTASIVINSKKVTGANLTALETILYGAVGVEPRLPLPDEVIGMFAGALTLATPTQPTFVSGTGVITIPVITGVVYRRADTNAIVTGTVTITPATPGTSLIIYANPAAGYYFPAVIDQDWMFTRT